ncbi:MAG: hypothetical protein D6763_07415, partial [Alphaproteobacteria bacterium]
LDGVGVVDEEIFHPLIIKEAGTVDVVVESAHGHNGFVFKPALAIESDVAHGLSRWGIVTEVKFKGWNFDC